MKRKRRSTGKIKYGFVPVFVVAVLFAVGFKTINSEKVVEAIKNAPAKCNMERVIGTFVNDAELTFTGDLMVHSYQYEEAYNPQTGEYDFMHNFTDMKKYFDKSDFVIGNFETVTAGEDVGISDYPMFNTPDSFVDAVKYAGFDLVTTANNHCMDKGMKGALRTIQVLDEKGIDHIGTYASEEMRSNIYMKNVNGINIAFLSYTYGTNGIPVPESWLVNILDEQLVKSDISRAKELNPDIIVVLPHMGNEYEEYVRDTFKNWAHMMLDAGADIVVASHPHILQPMEMVDITDDDGSQRKGFVMYSMGNFISSQTTPPRNASILLNIELEKKNNKTEITEVSYIPIWTQFRVADNSRNYFVVRSVYEMLTLPEDELNKTVRQKDILRLKDIHHETAQTLLNRDIPLEEIQNEYIFYQR